MYIAFLQTNYQYTTCIFNLNVCFSVHYFFFLIMFFFFFCDYLNFFWKQFCIYAIEFCTSFFCCLFLLFTYRNEIPLMFSAAILFIFQFALSRPGHSHQTYLCLKLLKSCFLNVSIS